MLLALLSDTHDNAASAVAALALLAPYKPGAYLHAGDLVAPEMLRLFAGLPLHFVFGNNEYDLPAIRSMAKSLGHHCHEKFGALEFEGKRVALLHGDEGSRMARVVRRVGDPGEDFDYVVHGHTHVRRDERIPGGPRVINPGALQRARRKSVALLDVGADRVEFLEVG